MSPLIDFFIRESREIFREPAGFLKYPFIVPGSVYQTQLWDWDAFWTAKGLYSAARLGGHTDLREKLNGYAKGVLQNFFEAQAENGAIPILMEAERRDVFGSTAEGAAVNQAKPVLGQLALLVADESGDAEWFRPLFPALERFYARWDSYYGSHTGLIVWGCDVAVGVDNDPTAYGRPDFSSANLLLNTLYYQDLNAAATLAGRLGMTDRQQRFEARAAGLEASLQQHCWDPRDQFFYTADVQCHDTRAERIPWAKPGMPMSWSSLPLRVEMFTGFLPLWSGIATQEQAGLLVSRHLCNPESFGAEWGVRTLSRRERMYSLAQSGNPSNWLGPVWILANYLVWKGLSRYGFRQEAEALGRKTIRLLENDLERHGLLHEYYHPDTAEPLMNPGFLSWNVLAAEMLAPSSINP